MQEAFAVIVIVVAVGGFLVAILTLVSSGSAYEEIGKGGLDQQGAKAEAPPGTKAARAESEAEVRELLEARSARRVRRGGEPLDVEAELARLLASVEPEEVDEELRQEVHDLVVAANSRRRRRGEPEVDVDAEVERRLREL